MKQTRIVGGLGLTILLSCQSTKHQDDGERKLVADLKACKDFAHGEP